ncbi:MAG: PD-(D/E)XK nuclease family transposase [Muribaculaceae bacterium]|nr:PD-(D/E)XK nuclease family transposase [Muribaculaceae bacterium]
MSIFVDPFLDTGFKRIFGTEDVSNDILCAFLNALFADDPVLSNIVSVHYRPTERTRVWNGGKSIAYDVHCETSTGHRFIIEMQANDQVYFLQRAFYYVARAVADQGYKGKQDPEGVDWAGDAAVVSEPEPETYWNYDVIPVVGVFLSDFLIEGLPRKAVTRCRFVDEQGHVPVGDYMRMVFIQMPAFRKRKDECDTPLDQWIYNLKYMPGMQTMAFTSDQAIFRRLASVASLTQLSPAERREYDYELKKTRDYYAEMATARLRGEEQGRAEGLEKGLAEGLAEGLEKGLAEGLAEGLEKGRVKGRAEGIAEGRLGQSLEIARNLIAMGMTDEAISAATNLPVKDVKALHKGKA